MRVFGDANSAKKVGNWHAVKKGDLFIISTGATPVAIGEALGRFTLHWQEYGLPLRACDVEEFFEGAEVVVCPARIRILSKSERGEDWGIDRRKTFCRAFGAEGRVNEWWNKNVEAPQTEQFEIQTCVSSLCGKGGLFNDDTKYKVPIYQRPYSWGEAELRRLMEDLRQGMDNKESIFLGTMQLGEPVPLSPDGQFHSHDVIDGQQRLTTFLLLLSVLESLHENNKRNHLKWGQAHLRTSVNKRAAQDDLDAGWMFLKKRTPDNWKTISAEENANNPYIKNARLLYGLVKEFATREDEELASTEASDSDVTAFATDLYQYMMDGTKIKFVLIETRAGLSKTLKIFDSINSAGMDLGGEDLFKIHFYEYRKTQGDSEKTFDAISEIYEMVAEYNRHPAEGMGLSMRTVLGTWQRQIIVENGLNTATFGMSADRFFDQLFETQLGVHMWSDFKNFRGELKVDALRDVVEKHIQYLHACAEDPELRIWRQLFWETRYGYAFDSPVLALLNGVADKENLKGFTSELVKALVPASLYYGRHVYAGRGQLFDLLKAMRQKDFPKGGGVGDWCQKTWMFGGVTLPHMIDCAMTYEIASTPKWKNLICKLIEFVKSPEKDSALFVRLFTPESGFDVEHIQSFTAENQQKRQLLGWDENDSELNRIGNLVMFESRLNRKVKNRQQRKPDAYGESMYMSLRELRDKVQSWGKKEAIERRKDITVQIKRFLFD